MPIVAKASNTVRNKNIILVLMCTCFAAWFAYDGFIGWPSGNDASVAKAAGDPAFRLKFSDDELAKLKSWPGQAQSTEKLRLEIYDMLHRKTPDLTFRADSEISLQRMIVAGLDVATLGAVWYFFKCQRRRAILDVEGKTLSPRTGLTIPIDAITKIDNTRWKKTGIVDITYQDASGGTAETELDDYKLDGLPPLLNELSTLAEKAEFIPPAGAPTPAEEPAVGTPEPETPEST